MKIELLKKTNEVGEIYYAIYKDGNFVSGSVATTLEQAEEYFQMVVKRNKAKIEIEIVKSIDL